MSWAIDESDGSVSPQMCGGVGFHHFSKDILALAPGVSMALLDSVNSPCRLQVSFLKVTICSHKSPRGLNLNLFAT